MLSLQSDKAICGREPTSLAVHPKLSPQLHVSEKPEIAAEEVEKLTASGMTPSKMTEVLGEHPLRILIAPSGFKESLGPEQVADAIEAGLSRVVAGDGVIMRKLPLHDGGEGFCRALVAAQGGHIINEVVTGPVGKPVQSHLGFIGEGRKTAVIDMAAAAGLRLVPKDMRDPTVTTTYGVGELMRKALDLGCTKIIVGCGDSGTSDGGVGMLQALGVQFLDADGVELPKADGGRMLPHLRKICWCGIHQRLRGKDVFVEAVCNIKNMLCGPKGVARVYGPQKGATPEQVEELACGLEKLATVAENDLKVAISNVPGSGASGGLGAGLLMLGAQLRARDDAINEYFEFDRVFDSRWDLVITAEGSLDIQSTQGKMTTEIARRAKRHGAQVVALAGTIGEGADGCYGAGIRAFTSILSGPSTLEEAIAETDKLIKDGAEKVIRMVLVGLALGKRWP